MSLAGSLRIRLNSKVTLRNSSMKRIGTTNRSELQRPGKPSSINPMQSRGQALCSLQHRVRISRRTSFKRLRSSVFGTETSIQIERFRSNHLERFFMYNKAKGEMTDDTHNHIRFGRYAFMGCEKYFNGIQ